MILMKSDDPVTNVLAATMLLRWNAHKLTLPHNDGEYHPTKATLAKAAYRAANTQWATQVAKRGLLVSQEQGALHIAYKEGKYEVTTNADIKNLVCIMLEERGVTRRQARRNWTMLRKHLTKEMKEKGIV